MKSFLQFLEAVQNGESTSDIDPKAKKPKKDEKSDAAAFNDAEDDEIEDGSEDETKAKKDSKGKGTTSQIRSESLEENHLNVGDSVWVKHPTDKSKTLTGKIAKVGRTGYSIKHKDGSEASYPHKDVTSDYPHKNPYAKNESAEMTDMEKEQKAIYDAQSIQFKKDAKANSELKAKPMKESTLDEISTQAKHAYVAAAQKSVSELGRQAQAAALKGDKETMKKKAEKLGQRNDTAIRTMGKADIETRKKWNSDFGKNESVDESAGKPEDHGFAMGGSHSKISKEKYDSELSKMKGTKSNGNHKASTNVDEHKGNSMVQTYSHASYGHPSLVKVTTKNNETHHYMAAGTKNESTLAQTLIAHKKESLALRENSPFDWKNTKSQINWKSDDKASDSTTHKGTYGSETHVAPSDRNAAGKSNAPKKSVGRPAGSYNGNYKQRTNKEASAAQSAASKEDGNKARAEFKRHLHSEIMKKQLKSSGLNPDDHKDAMDKILSKVSKIK